MADGGQRRLPDARRSRMTQAVSFQFTSPQFAFDSGLVAFMKGARLFSDGDFRTGRITNGAIDGVLVEGPIEFDALLSELTITRRTDNRSYYVPFLPVSGAIRPPEISAGRVSVELDIPVIVVMRVEDAAGATVPHATVSFSIPSTTATFEGPINEEGALALLGVPGRFSFHLLSAADRWLAARGIRSELEVKASDRGERHVVLRVPA
jgi:hypothetical protein